MTTSPANTSTWDRWRPAFAIDLRSLALFRIGIGVVVLLVLAHLWPEVPEFYTDEGILPRASRPMLNVEEAFPGLCWQISPYMLTGNATTVRCLFVIQGLVAFGLLIGWKTRWMAVVTWLLLVGLQARNPVIMTGGDDVLRTMLFFGLFLPLGARWSVDARLRARSEPATDLPPDVAHLGTAAFILQLLCVYFFTGLLKSDPVWRTEYTALHYALHLDHLTTAFGYQLAAYPLLTKVLTFGTMLLEHLGPVLLLVPQLGWLWRLALAASFMSLHIGIFLCCSIGLFPFTCIVCWMAFIPTEAMNRAENFVRRLWTTVSRKTATTNVTAVWTPGDAPAVLRLTTGSKILLGGLVAYMLLLNVIRLDGRGVYSNLGNGPLKVLGEAAQINQYWCMFAARPAPFGGWYDMRATLADGREVNLWNPELPVQETRPALVSTMYPSLRWRKTCMIMFERHSPTHRNGLGEYLVRRYEQTHPGTKVVDARIILRAAISPDPDEPAKANHELIVPVVMWQRSQPIGDPREQLAIIVSSL